VTGRAALLALPLALCAATAGAQVPAPRSGYEFLAAETRAMQDDDFSNPGFFAVERGAKLWDSVEGAAGKACASCHAPGDTAIRTAGVSHPKIDPASGQLFGLERRINQCRAAHMGAAPRAYESVDLVALTAFVRHQARGLAVAVATDGAAAAHAERGRAFFEQRRGLFDLSCADCHDRNPGRKLRAEAVSEGHVNGFPAYKLKWQEVGSTHRQFQRCEALARSIPHEAGSPEYLDLELYLAARGNGLKVETPAVRP
jgi:sulfur-oxidizing protein SoxA